MGSIREYVNQFTTLMLDISNMHEAGKLFFFLKGLQPWAQRELQRRDVQDLASAIAAAEKLMDIEGEGRERGG